MNKIHPTLYLCIRSNRRRKNLNRKESQNAQGNLNQTVRLKDAGRSKSNHNPRCINNRNIQHIKPRKPTQNRLST